MTFIRDANRLWLICSLAYDYEAGMQLSSQPPATPQKTFDATAQLPIGFPPLRHARTDGKGNA
jgi:hypothetical protein